MTQTELAEVLGVTTDTLKAWRSKRMSKSPRHLVPDMPPLKRESCYSPSSVAAWLMKNPDYRDRVVALLAPEPEFLHAQPVATVGLGVIIPDNYVDNYQLQGESA